MVVHVRFSPTDPQHFMSVSSNRTWHWNINGYQTNPAHNGSCTDFSLDGNQFVSHHGKDITVHNSSSGEIMAKFYLADGGIHNCCFSPDGRLIAAAAGNTVYIWDTTSSHPQPIKTFVGHTGDVTSLAFSSPFSLISSSYDKSVKFWEISTAQANPAVAGPESTSLTSAQILSITLQAEHGIAISSHSDGVVRTWNILTGLCEASFQTIAKSPKWGDVQMMNSRLIFVWCVDRDIHIWDVEKEELLHTIYALDNNVEDVRISGDGSNIFYLDILSIKAQSMETGKVVGQVILEGYDFDRCLTVDGSRVWVHSPSSESLGWDFATPGSPPVQLSNSLLLLTKNAKLWDICQSKIKDAVTGRVVCQLSGRFENPVTSQWDGHYLVTGYESGEVLILDFNHVHF